MTPAFHENGCGTSAKCHSPDFKHVSLLSLSYASRTLQQARLTPRNCRIRSCSPDLHFLAACDLEMENVRRCSWVKVQPKKVFQQKSLLELPTVSHRCGYGELAFCAPLRRVIGAALHNEEPLLVLIASSLLFWPKINLARGFGNECNRLGQVVRIVYDFAKLVGYGDVGLMQVSETFSVAKTIYSSTPNIILLSVGIEAPQAL